MSVATVLTAAEEATLSDGALAAVSDYRLAMSDAEQDFAEAKVKAKDRLTRALEREVEKVTRMGKLDEALAIRDLLASVTAAEQEEAQAPNGVDLMGGPLPGVQPTTGEDFRAGVEVAFSYKYTRPPTNEGGGIDYHDWDHIKLTDGHTHEIWEKDRIVGWNGRDLGEIWLEFPTATVHTVRVHVLGGHGRNVPAPQSITVLQEGHELAKVEQPDDVSGWVNLPLLRPTRLSKLTIVIGASGGSWTMIDEIQLLR